MPFKTAIKWIHRFVTVLLLVLVGAFLWLNHQPTHRESDELKRAYKLSDDVWLYMTANDEGGTTVPTIYRYYLSKEIHGDNKDIAKTLATIPPVIVGTGSIVETSVDKKGEVTLSYSGKVFSVREDIGQLKLTLTP
ncbi:hypothetical protein EGM70_17765 [Enterobacteriaceae bacterium 89]|nr:hypothetical protein [Enterobacteriaceae bacterium 89]